jgi:ABC-type transport system involved in multi-copper enzyme maturation permease subunit
MRPYLAIIIDSFRAALASRVLYVLLGLITILLLVLAPIHLREVMDWKIQFGEHVKNPRLLVTQLVEKKDSRPDVKRIWERLPTKSRDGMLEIYAKNDGDEPKQSRGPGNPDLQTLLGVIEDLNEIIKDPTFYDKETWKDRLLPTEAEELIEEGPESLNEERSRRLNRLLISNSFPATIEAGSPTAMDFYFAVWKLEFLSSSATRQQFKTGVSLVIPYVFDKFVLSLGLLIAILVTANIIPETFDPGSLNLLLSKPISRSALYISKFIGGCSFIALCAVYLFLGVWLWLGLGLGIWDKAFLWSIPLYILVFAIYYSISSLVGLTYRSAIMAIVVTGLFWAICFGVGSIHGFLHTRTQNFQVVDVTPVGEKLVAVNAVGSLLSTDSIKANAWSPGAEAELQFEEQQAIGVATWFGVLMEDDLRLSPVFDETTNRVYAPAFSVVNPFGINHQEFHVADADTMKFKKIGRFPRDLMAMFETAEGLLFVTSNGRISNLPYDQIPDEALEPETKKQGGSKKTQPANDIETQVSEDKETDEDPKSQNDQQSTKPKITRKQKIADRVQKLGPARPVTVKRRGNVDYNQSNGEIAIFNYRNNRHMVHIFAMEDGKYEKSRSVEIDTGATARMRCKLAYQGNTIIVAVGNGQIISIDATTMKEQQGYLPETQFAMQTLRGSKNGRWFGLLCNNQTLWILDTENDSSMSKAAVGGQGTISAFGFQDNSLWVVDRSDRVTQYDPETMTEQQTFSPGGTVLEKAYRYVVKPFYTICPKPSEFYRVVSHLSAASDSKYDRNVDLTRVPKSTDPFSPLWSGLIFMVAMLGLACIVFHYKDF